MLFKQTLTLKTERKKKNDENKCLMLFVQLDIVRLLPSLVCFKGTVKILKIGTPEIITIIVLQLEQLDFTVQHSVQKMQTE